MKFISAYRLEIISFVIGFTMLAYELIAARLMAPYLGSSMYVWTSVIGVIIAALSFGYYAGGKIADARNLESDIVRLLLISAAGIAVTIVWYTPVLQWAIGLEIDVRLAAVAAASILFAPTSFVIGAISPYLAKRNVTSLETSGSKVASLSAYNAVGGIMGTFVTGFIVFGYVGVNQALVILATSLVVASWLVAGTRAFAKRSALSIAIVVAAILFASAGQAFTRIDTANATYVVDEVRYSDGRLIQALYTGPGGTQSAVYKDGSGELVFWYAKRMAEIVEARDPESILVLGGGAFTLPEFFAKDRPNTQVDAVEIDPELETIARQYFDFEGAPNLDLYFEDARTYLETTDKTYDLILIDVYGDTSIPFTFTTREYVDALEQRLATDGIVAANIIAGSGDGPCGEVLRDIDAAYRTEFPNAVSVARDPGQGRTNNIVVYSKERLSFDGFATLNRSEAVPYTDNYAPSERIYQECSSS